MLDSIFPRSSIFHSQPSFSIPSTHLVYLSAMYWYYYILPFLSNVRSSILNRGWDIISLILSPNPFNVDIYFWFSNWLNSSPRYLRSSIAPSIQYSISSPPFMDSMLDLGWTFDFSIYCIFHRLGKFSPWICYIWSFIPTSYYDLLIDISSIVFDWEYFSYYINYGLSIFIIGLGIGIFFDLYCIFNLIFFHILSLLLTLLALSSSSFNGGFIIIIPHSIHSQSIDLHHRRYNYNHSHSFSTMGSCYLDSMALFLPILLLFLIIFVSMLLLYSIELYSLSAIRMEVIGSQWCWYYYYHAHCWSWYYHSPSPSPVIIPSTDYYSSLPHAFIERLLDNDCRIYYLYHHSIQLTQSLISSYSFRDNWSHIAAVDHLIYLTLSQSLSITLTSMDVIHSYGINSLLYRYDCILGRFNSLYYYYLFSIGLNKGYCYELCGIGHFSMQIAVIILSSRPFQLALSFSFSICFFITTFPIMIE